MTYCSHIPGFCGKRSDCKDTHCPGHPGISDEEADQRIASPEEAEDWCARLSLWFLAAVTLSCVAAIFITFAKS